MDYGNGNMYTLSEEEIRILSMKPSDVLKERIAAGGANEDALKAFAEMQGLFKNVHDFLDLWAATFMSSTYELGGNEALSKAMYKVMWGPWSKKMEHYWDMSFHDQVIMSVNGGRMSHDVGVVFDYEDDEKLAFHMEPCGSGQMLREKGVYEGEVVLALCEPHHCTGGLDKFPCYCVHAPIGDQCAIDKCGYPQWVMEYPETVASCACQYICYKRKEDIPEKYWTRVGRVKPKSK